MRVANRIWDEDALRAIRAAWLDNAYSIPEIEQRFELKNKALTRPNVRQALGLQQRKMGAKLGSMGRPVHKRPKEFNHCHPLVRRMYLLAIKRQEKLTELANSAGLNPHTISNWRRQMPKIDTLDAVLNVMGYRLAIERIGDEEDNRPMISGVDSPPAQTVGVGNYTSVT